MTDNQLIKTVLLPAIVIAGLFVLYYLPDISIGEDKQLRKVNILADVMLSQEETDSVQAVILAQAQEERRQMFSNDSIFPGVVPIEDFSSKDTLTMMDRFYSRLDTLKRLHRPVRIAYFGDSFIGCDILTGHLREMFQDKYGGCGIGAVDVAMPDARFTLLQSVKGLDFHVATHPKNFSSNLQGLSCSYSIAEGNASVRLSGTKNSTRHSSQWNTSLLFFRASKPATINCRINGEPIQKVYSGQSSDLQVARVDGKINNVEWLVNGGTYYLVANEDTTGVSVDNFSLVSAPGMQLKNIPQETLEEFAALRDYDLIIFQYGLNVATPKEKEYRGFRLAFNDIIENFRKAWPEAALMMVSVSDRCKGYNNGQPQAMTGIEELVVTQRDIAKKHHIAFWSLYEAMGGKGGIATMQKNGEANKDFTHINHKGGKQLAKRFYDAFNNGMFNYKRRYETSNK